MNRTMNPSRSTRRTRRRPAGALRDLRAWRLCPTEELESRIAPAGTPVFAGGLEFLPSSAFRIGQDEYVLEAPGSTVEIGYKPVDQEDFTPLIRVTLDGTFSKFTLDTENSLDAWFLIDQEFTLTCIAVTGSEVPAFPIAKNTDEAD